MPARERQESHTRVTEEDGLPGFVLMDPQLNPLYMNKEALKILAYPDGQGSEQTGEKSLAGKVQSFFCKLRGNLEPPFVKRVQSGRRSYFCRAFSVSPPTRNGSPPPVAVLIERNFKFMDPQMVEDFHLTEREQEVVQLLSLGLTSKEIANRMGISPNTVKAFLRLVMIKTGVTTRSGIVGKMLQDPRRAAGSKPVYVASAKPIPQRPGLLQTTGGRQAEAALIASRLPIRLKAVR